MAEFYILSLSDGVILFSLLMQVGHVFDFVDDAASLMHVSF